MQLRLTFYQNKIDCYNYKVFYLSLIIVKKILIEDTQKKMRNKSKQVITKKKPLQKRTRKEKKDEKATRYTVNTRQNGCGEYFPISNQFEYKRIKFLNQQPQSA